jgi:periodic tryptophan protein 2
MNFKFQNLVGTVYKQGNLIFVNDTVVSPVGNRVSLYGQTSCTLDVQTLKDVARLACNGSLLILIDIDGRALLVNYLRHSVLHHHSFKAPVLDAKFSPDGKYLAVTHQNIVQVWKTPGYTVEFAPFVLFGEFAGHYDQVTCICWSPDSKHFLTGSKDMTCRLYSIDKDHNNLVLTGHRDTIVNAFFSNDMTSIYSVSRDGAVFHFKSENALWELDAPIKKQKTASFHSSTIQRYKAHEKHYFNQNNSKVTCAEFHAGKAILAVGFDNGIFGIYEMPDFVNIHSLRYTFLIPAFHKKNSTRLLSTPVVSGLLLEAPN